MVFLILPADMRLLHFQYFCCCLLILIIDWQTVGVLRLMSGYEILFWSWQDHRFCFVLSSNCGQLCVSHLTTRLQFSLVWCVCVCVESDLWIGSVQWIGSTNLLTDGAKRQSYFKSRMSKIFKLTYVKCVFVMLLWHFINTGFTSLHFTNIYLSI